ncbi:MAG: alginate export family protein [Phycisphaerae bacterium]|nr:alginate export family protein [Tepidisphaeraceae bacterium]
MGESRVLILAGFLAMLVTSARAQTSVERFNRQLEQIQRETMLRADPALPVDQRTLFDYGGQLSLNYALIEDLHRETHVLRQADLLGYVRVNVDGVHEWYARGVASYQDFNDGDSFDGEGDEAHFRLDRAYYRFDYQRYLAAYEGRAVDYNVAVQGGRQLTYWGNGLALSQVLDGAAVDLVAGRLSLQLIGGVTPVHDTVDFDASRPHFDDHTRRGFYGALLSLQLTPNHTPFVYAVAQQDYNHDEVRSTGVFQTRFNYNTWYVGAGSTGTLGDRIRYGVEFVYEGGRGLSNSFVTPGGPVVPVDQTEEDVDAWAVDVRLDYLFTDLRRTRLSAELILASGDDDRLHTSDTFGGNKPGTSDRAFNGFGLVNTGLAFAPAVSNLMAVRVGASTFPMPEHSRFRRLQVGADLFVFGKLEGDAPIDEPTLTGRYLGIEPDVFVNWQITSDVTLAVRYGVFFPNSDVVVSGDVRQFIFAGLTIAF